MRRAAIITLGAALIGASVVLGSLSLSGGGGSVVGASDNAMGVDANPSTGGIDPVTSVGLYDEFDVSVNITAAPNPYAGYEMWLEFDDTILTFVPVGTYNVVYTGLGGATIHLPSDVPPNDVDGDTLPDVYGGTARGSGTSAETGQAIVVRFQCIAEGMSPLHLLTDSESGALYSKTLGLGGVPLATSLTDASVTCGVPTTTPIPPVTSTPCAGGTCTPSLTPTATITPTATPTSTPTPCAGGTCTPTATPTATGNAMAVDADPSTQDIDPTTSIGHGDGFDVGVNVTGASLPYQAYEMALEFDDTVLSFVPVGDDGVVYTGLGGATLYLPAKSSDWDGDTLPELYGGAIVLFGTSSETGQAVLVRFRCDSVGTSPLHLLTGEESSIAYTVMWAEGVERIPTSLTDASVTCRGIGVDMEPGTAGVQTAANVDLDEVSDFSIDVFAHDIPDPGLGSFSFDLVYDDSRVDATAVLEGPFLASSGAGTSCSVQDPDFGPGRARLTCAVTSGTAAQGDGVLGTIHFDILPLPGGDPLSFTLEATSLTDAGTTPISHVAQDGSADVIGVIERLAGTGEAGYSGDGGAALSAKVSGPHGVFDTGTGNSTYFADTDNHRVRKIDAAGTITTVAGNGTGAYCGDNGPALDACLNRPHDVFLDAAGNLYIADTDNHRIRKVDTGGTITTVAGTGEPAFYGDGGPAVNAKLNGPRGLAVDGSGNILIADTENHRIRKVDAASGVIATVAGNGSPGFSGDGGPAIAASLNRPHDVHMYGELGDFVIADTMNHRIRLVRGHTGNILTFAGSGLADFGGDDGLATLAHLNGPQAVVVDSVDPRLPNVFIADTQNNRIRRVDGHSAIITTVVGEGSPGSAGDDGPATAAQLYLPGGVTVGPLVVSDTENNTLRAIDPSTGKPGGRFSGVLCMVGSVSTADWYLVALVLGLILARRRIGRLVVQIRLLARLAPRPEASG